MQTATLGEPFADGRPGAIDMFDLAAYRTERRVERIAHDPDGVTLLWDDGRESRFDAIWLRDNCACPDCRHPQAMERRFLLIDAPEAIALAGAVLTADGNLVVRFAPEGPDGEPHVGRFTAAWLRHHDYSDAARAARAWAPRLWDAGLAKRLPIFDYAAVMTTDAGLHDWLVAIRDWGVALVRNAPAAEGELERLAERVGPPRPTNFGSMFNVVSMPNPNASADTAMGLEPHTDLANWRWPSDFLLLFCITNEAERGGSIVVDGFHTAEELRVADPEAFEFLMTRPIDFRFHDQTCDIRHRAPTIELDRAGRVSSVRFNNWLRAALDLPAADIVLTYRALRRFWGLLRDPRFQVRLSLKPGEMLAVDNNRVLHGREPFDPKSGRRHFQGCHLDRDLVLSRLRLLDR